MEATITQQRSAAIAAAMDDIRGIETSLGITREAVEQIRDRLIELSTQRELFPLEDFPVPGPDLDRASFLYRLAQDDDDRFALYAQRSRGNVNTPVHNHTTWAVVVGFEGQELNRFFDRADNPGDGVKSTHEHMVQAGTGVAMLPDDLHSIHLDAPALNFHCYGLALEQLAKREYWHEGEGRWKIFSATSDIIEMRPELSAC